MRSIRFNVRTLFLLGFGLGCLFASDGRAASVDKVGFTVFGDFRIRAEADWDSQNSGGIDRKDRNRIRIRARLGLNYAANDVLSFGVRLRTGSDFSQQSPHITILDFDGNDTGDADFNLDKWSVKARGNKLWGSVGRDSLPLWKQNEMLWDDDVTPAGVAGGFKTRVGENGDFTVNLGYFSLPVGLRKFAGNLASAQLVYSAEFGGVGFIGAFGHLSIDANRDDADATSLLQGNGIRDYAIWVASLQGRLSVGERPLTLGADVMSNVEDYPSTDPRLPSGDPDQITFDNRDETEGYVLSVKLGGLQEKGDWWVAYSYARIEKFAVNSSYAQDDWVRWGSATEARGSDMKGHELRFAYAVGKESNLVLRLYVVEAITSVENGNRFRADYNRKF